MGEYSRRTDAQDYLEGMAEYSDKPGAMEALRRWFGHFDDLQRLSNSEEMVKERLWNRLSLGLSRIGREDILRNPRVLEVGCFEAQLLKYLLRQKIDAVGIDTDPRHLGNVPGRIFQMDAEKTSFSDQEFDIAVTDGIFDKNLYDNDNGKIFAELGRIIRPGGVLYVNDLVWSEKHTRIQKDQYDHLFEEICCGEDFNSVAIKLLIRR